MKANFKNERGQALIMITLSLMTLCGVMGLVVDLGWSYFIKKSAQSAADSAALASAEAALATVGQRAPFACSGGVGCLDISSCSGAADNIQNGCQYAQQNGFTAGGKSGRQNVTMAANITSPPPTVGGISTIYWATARVTERTPQLFSAVLGNMWGTTSARATAAVFDSPLPGSLYLLNRENDVAPTGVGIGVGVDAELGGSSSITVPGAVIVASTAHGGGGTGDYAGQTAGSVSVTAGKTEIRGNGTVDSPGSWHPAPKNGYADGFMFQDPMQGKGQPPPPVQSQVPDHPVLGGTISGDCNDPTVLSPGTYYATGITGVPTGAPLSVTGCVKFGSGSGTFANYVFIGGANFTGVHSVITFSPGRYILAGHQSGGSIFSQSNGVTLTDNTPTDTNGKSVDNIDAGEIFVSTDLDYPGLYVPPAITGSGLTFQYGSIDMQMGNDAMSAINLHGLNKNSTDLPAELQPFAPVVLWQDQGNSAIQYNSQGYVDTTSCGSGHNLDTPCANTDSTVLDPAINLQAHPNLKLNGVIYQPRGSALTFQGHGTLDAPVQVITGSIVMSGGPSLNFHKLTNPPTTRVVALVE